MSQDSQNQREERQIQRQKMSPEEAQVATTVFRCFFESTVISGTAAYVAFKSTKNYINKSNSATLKSWSTILNVSTAFIAFTAARSMYGKVCINRVENLPQSKYKDSVLRRWKEPFNNSDEFRENFMKKLEERSKVQPMGSDRRFVLPSSPGQNIGSLLTRNPYEPQNGLTDRFASNHTPLIGNEAQTSNKSNPVVDSYDSSELSGNESNQDEDLSTLNQGSDEANKFDYTKPHIIRRNKYGDIIEEA